MYELYHGKDMTASDLVERLSIDKGYLSRVLLQFAKRKFLSRERSQRDTRVVFINLTQAGKKEFEMLNKASNDQVKEILRNISEKDLDLLLASMSQIKTILKQSKNKSEGEINLALFTDGLRVEREQRITIDVAYK